MKTLSIKGMKAAASRIIIGKEPEAKKVVTNAIKDGEAKIADGQNALAEQNKFLVGKKYTKPEMEKAELNKEKVRAASGDDVDPRHHDDGEFGEDDGFGGWGSGW